MVDTYLEKTLKAGPGWGGFKSSPNQRDANQLKSGGGGGGGVKAAPTNSSDLLGDITTFSPKSLPPDEGHMLRTVRIFF